MVSPSDRRRACEELQRSFCTSERRACRVVGLWRSTNRRKRTRAEADRELVQALHQESERYPRWGYRKLCWLLKAKGYRVGKERIRLLRKQHGLKVSVKQKRRKIRGKSTSTVTAAEHPNHVWSYDFKSDQLADGRRLRLLTVVDEYTRKCICIYAARHITSGDVRRQLEWLFRIHGTPECLRSDNGPELVARDLQRWLAERNVATRTKLAASRKRWAYFLVQK
ncbi:MAG: transposase [Bdellovibrionales bacterium]|nr:transposase [Bdellovibrionales bacterium]